MPRGYAQIPDWFSFENQGGNIAVAELTATGTQDLVVVAVDSPAGRNRGVYRVGRAVDANGIVQGGWTPWIDVPDWFSFENQGVGVAVGDVDGDGRQDVVVFMIDSPNGRNQGFYRIGYQLDQNGNVLRWGPWLQVPDWFSFDNQHGAVALADLDADGTPELIVGMIDAPEGPNRALYRIGRSLQADGTVDEWTPWFEVPGWFSWENQGLGLAVVRTDDHADLLVFQIDGAIDQNQAFFKIGSHIHVNGNIGEWGPWQGVPAWFTSENQGGGIAVATVGGKRSLTVFMIDNPVGQNAGYYRLLPMDPDPARDGQWELLPYHSQVLPVHLALLPTGKVLVFAGSGSSATRFNAADFGNVAHKVFTSVVWDPAGPPPGVFTHPATLVAPNHRPFDFFCGGDAFLPDGRLISVGGTNHYNNFGGRNDVCVFDPAAEAWTFLASMQHGRWYPSVVTLGDGQVLAASGLTEDHQNTPHNQTLELYNAGTNQWRTLKFPPGFPGLPLYPHVFQMADGLVVFDGGRMDDDLQVDPCLIDLTHDPVAVQPIPGMVGGGMRNQSASVLLPPAQDQRVMIIGGGPAGKPNKTDAIDNVDVVDCRVRNPHFVPAAPLNFGRLHLNAILLPDRTVFVTGGSLKQEDAPLARLQSEIYDPQTDTWTPTASSTVPRLYHSTAVLLPDGRVLSAGGNPEGGTHVQWDQDPEEEMRLEIFSPPYLFRGARPVIQNAPAQAAWGQAIQINTPQAATIKWVSLIRNCVTTHSFDGSQRLVDLPITQRAAGALTVTVPNNRNVLPPGMYMLFIASQAGVPSVARWLRVG
jgi:hypothetical protein